MKLKISRDELWPVYGCYENASATINISEEKLKWIRETEAEFEKVQEYLNKLWEKQKSQC